MIGKNYKISCKNGKVFAGFCTSYISAIDNEPEIESISIGENEIFITEIKAIEIIN